MSDGQMLGAISAAAMLGGILAGGFITLAASHFASKRHEAREERKRKDEAR